MEGPSGGDPSRADQHRTGRAAVLPATMAPSESAPPISITIPPAVRNGGVQPGSVDGATRISPRACIRGRRRVRDRALALPAPRGRASRRGGARTPPSSPRAGGGRPSAIPRDNRVQAHAGTSVPARCRDSLRCGRALPGAMGVPYLPRTVDGLITGLPAVMLVGPRATGKTTRHYGAHATNCGWTAPTMRRWSGLIPISRSGYLSSPC